MGLPAQGEQHRWSAQLPFDVDRLLKQKVGTRRRFCQEEAAELLDRPGPTGAGSDTRGTKVLAREGPPANAPSSGQEKRGILRDGSPGGEDSSGLEKTGSRLATERFLQEQARCCSPRSHGLPPAATPKKKTRTVFSKRQILHLEATFHGKHYLSGAEKAALAHALHLTETQVKIWFQNRRNKRKRQVSLDLEGDPPAVPRELPLGQGGRPVLGAARTRSFSAADKVVFSQRVLSSTYTPFPPLCFTREAPSLVSFSHMLANISASCSGTGRSLRARRPVFSE